MPTRLVLTQIFSFFLTAFFLLSCQGNSDEPQRPEVLVEKSQMVEALVAIHILEQQLNDLRIPKPQKQDSFKLYQQKVFDRLSIDSTSYYGSYNYYATPQHIKEMKEIMEKVTDSLGSLRDQASPTRK